MVLCYLVAANELCHVLRSHEIKSCSSMLGWGTYDSGLQPYAASLRGQIAVMGLQGGILG